MTAFSGITINSLQGMWVYHRTQKNLHRNLFGFHRKPWGAGKGCQAEFLLSTPFTNRGSQGVVGLGLNGSISGAQTEEPQALYVGLRGPYRNLHFLRVLERSHAGLSGTDIPSALLTSLPGIFGSWGPLPEGSIHKSAKRKNFRSC